MARIVQPAGEKGSLHWIQRAVNKKWPSLEQPILARVGAHNIEWRSPISDDDYAEYRDADFLRRLGLGAFETDLKAFWPLRGPQWDALAVSDMGDILIVEAKSHIGEMCSPGTMSGVHSRTIIAERLAACAQKLGAGSNGHLWSDHFYQLANRLAHLNFLREQGLPAYLVLVNFLNDTEMGGPSSVEVWSAAYQVAHHLLGLPRRHVLSPFVIEVFPDVRLQDRTSLNLL